MSNQYAQSILDAAMMINTDSSNQSESTKIIEAHIVGIEDPGLGCYKVEFKENKYNAYSNNAAKYSVGDRVYVLVPDNDFTKTKTILGAIDPTPAMYASLNGSLFLEKSNNLLNITGLPIEMSSYRKEEISITSAESDVSIVNFSDFQDTFKTYLRRYKNFKFSCDIKTSIPIEQVNNGDYGLILSFWVNTADENGVNKEQEVTYKINSKNILGNPYGLSVYTPQNFYVQFLNDVEYLPNKNFKITVYSDFKSQDTEKPNDIFIKNIAITPVEILDESTQNGYYFRINASEGELFLKDGTTEKTLTPVLQIDGRKTSVNGYPCYWFVEDSSITFESKGYSSQGGPGWRCLNESVVNEENKEAIDFVTNVYEYKIKQSDIYTSLTYKCVILYNDMHLSNTIKIINLASDIKLSLETTTGLNLYSKYDKPELIMKVYAADVDKNELTAVWTRYDKSNNLVLNNDGSSPFETDGVFHLSEDGDYYYLKAKTELIKELTTINCSVKKGDILYGTESISLNLATSLTYRLIIENADRVYKYDADGDSPLSADYDGEPAAIRNIIPLEYRLYKDNGEELSETEYNFCNAKWTIPKQSMIVLKTTENVTEDDNNYYITGSGKINVPYSIITKYNYNKNDNLIHLEVTFDQKTYSTSQNLLFFKEGENGTNGTKYTAIIDYDGYFYNQVDEFGNLRKLQLYNVNNTWKILTYDANGNKQLSNILDNLALGISVYNGNKITNLSNISVSWSMFDAIDTKPCMSISSEGIITLDELDITKNPCSIIQAKVSFHLQESSIGANESIYAYYPVEICYLSGGNELPSIEGGFSNVLYASDGTNPRYDTSEIFNATKYEGYNYTWEVLNENLSIKAATANECEIEPANKYDNAQSKNIVKVTISKDDIGYKAIYIKPIIMTYNRYGLSAVNGWDGNKIYTGNNEEFIYAPQIGAGRKEDDNSFTGMIMGIRKKDGISKPDVGLFGYGKGIQTMFLNADNGAASFGVEGKGQIIIEPSQINGEYKGIIKGGNYVEKTSTTAGSGMYIDLSTPEIKFGTGNFSVTKEGYMTVLGGGKIAGWEILEDRLTSVSHTLTLYPGKGVEGVDKDEDIILPAIYSENHSDVGKTTSGFYLGPDGLSIGNSFRVFDSELKLGNLTSGAKYWTVSSKNGTSYIAYNTEGIATSTYGNNNSVYLGVNGISLGKYFKVANTGILELGNLAGKHWKAYANTGQDRSYIFYGKTDTPSLNCEEDSVYLGTDGISLGKNKFYVDTNGKAVLKSGQIGGWSIGETDLYDINNPTTSAGIGQYGGKPAFWAGTTYEIAGNEEQTPFMVTHDGKLIANNAVVKGTANIGGGSIGGWNINTSTITAGNITLNSNGSISGGSSGKTWTIAQDGTATFNSINIKNGKISNGNFEVTADGTLTAKLGKIGDWDITSTSLYKEWSYNSGAADPTTSVELQNTGSIILRTDDQNEGIYCEGIYYQPDGGNFIRYDYGFSFGVKGIRIGRKDNSVPLDVYINNLIDAKLQAQAEAANVETTSIEEDSIE